MQGGLLFVLLLLSLTPLFSFTNEITLSELLQTAKREGILNDTQVKALLELANKTRVKGDIISNGEIQPPQHGLFMKMYNQLTLLNVLYFSGTLLIIGAYSLLMGIAWEHCNSTGISTVMIGQTLIFGVIGISLWSTSYQFLGGLLCSISTGLVPYTVYWIQRSLQVWPVDDPGIFQGFRLYVRPGWVVMEIATVVVGLIYLFMVQFPFLLAPVSFCLWFLSMDIAPLMPQWNENNSFEVRRTVSIVFGLGLILAGRGMEWTLGSEPDFGFWLYLFGLIAFWFSLIFHPITSNPLYHSLFFLINVCLVLIGSHLNRATFHFFGTIGVGIMTFLTFSERRIKQSFLLWFMKALVVIALLAQAIKNRGSIEIVNAIVCFVSFNVESLIYIPSGEIYCLFVLFTNLGFVAAVPSFHHTLSLWFIQLDFLPEILSLFSLAVLTFHLPIAQYLIRRNHSPSTLSFLAYRGLMSVAISFILVFLRQPWFVWVGSMGIPLIAMIWQPRDYTEPVKVKTKTAQFVLLLISVGMSTYFQSNVFYLISCLCITTAVLTMLGQDEWVSAFGCVFSVFLIFLAIPLQSKFMLAIGGIYVFGYLSHLAYVVFKKSVLFPLALVGLGISMIYIGIIYQYYQDTLYENSLKLMPISWYNIIENGPKGLGSDWYLYFKEANFSFSSLLSSPLLWVFYPGTLIHSLAKESAPYASYVCSFGMLLVLMSMGYLKINEKYCPDLRSSVKVQSMKISLNDTGSKNGFIVIISGVKPAELHIPKYISLNIYGELFWSTMRSHFNSLAISVVRSAFLPYQLTPDLISTAGFQAGSTHFLATIRIGTGERGRPSIGRDLIKNNAQKVQGSSSVMYCTLLYSNAFYLPYTPLCSYDMPVDQACQMLLAND